MSNHDSEVTFEIKERVGVISTAPTGWTKEVNIVSWNGGVPKFDIREWSEDHERMSRGLTLQEKEMKRLRIYCYRTRELNERNICISYVHQKTHVDGTQIPC